MMKEIKFSIVMPSYLGNYPKAAQNRDEKILRAINSVVRQTYSNWELLIIADGCQKTVNIISNYFKELEGDYDIRLYSVPKFKLWGGIRNCGIHVATGDYVLYLDIDDEYLLNYLESLNKEMTDGLDWYWVNDMQLKGNNFEVKHADIDALGKHGTSNVVHKRILGARWCEGDYKEDFRFVRMLKLASGNYRKLNSCGYMVCHVPNKYDV